MADTQLPIDKLTLLFIAREAPGIRRSHLCDAALATLAMDYFDVARALDELASGGLLHLAVRKGERSLTADEQPVARCDLTPKGHAALAALVDQIPAPTRRFLIDHLNATALRRRTADAITAQVEATPEGHYRVVCRHDGDDNAFCMSLDVPTEAMARKAAATWRERSSDVYRTILESLLDDDRS